MITSSRPRVSLSTFAEFIVAPASRKIGTVQAAVEQYGKDYNPFHDFYRPWRDAAGFALASGHDSLALRRALAGARPVQLRHFRDLSEGWVTVRARSQLRPPTQASRVWSGAHLDIRMRPLAVWEDRTTLRHVAFYLKEPPLSKDGARAMLRLLALTEPGDYAVLDVRRGRLIRPVATAASFDAWLEGEANSFATMWHHLRKAA